MTKVKAIVSDFDGTLVGHDFIINPLVESAIKSYILQGNIFSIATGRAYAGLIEKNCNLLDTSDLTIVRGGSEIVSRSTRKIVWGRYINPKTLKNILSFLNTEKVLYGAEYGEYIYTIDGKPHPAFGKEASFKPLSLLPEIDVPKIVIFPENGGIIISSLLEKFTSMYSDLHVIRFTSIVGIGIDINDGGAGKHMALLEYSRLMNLDPSEILGVGDSYNDYPLLTACGIKVAMGNSPQELKDIADYVVSSQEENGILETIDIAINS